MTEPETHDLKGRNRENVWAFTDRRGDHRGRVPGGLSEEIVKTMDEYREEAAKDITKENAEQELENLKKEVESDTGSE